jgi:hypothetical protein
MRLCPAVVLTLSLAFASAGSLLRAQEASVPPAPVQDRCVRWMKAAVHATTTSTLDPADFCSGVKRGNTDGWYSIWKCGQAAAQLTAPRRGIARHPVNSERMKPGRLDLAPQQRTDASCWTERRTPRRTCTAAPLRSTAGLQCGWETSGCLRECTSLCLPGHRMAGSLPLPGRMENGAMPRRRGNIWEASR